MRRKSVWKQVTALTLALCLSVPFVSFAGEPIVTPLRIMNNAYYFETDKYTPEENMIPFKLAESFMFGGYGYADGNFNVVIPINESWEYADEFVEGIAVVKGSENYIAIDKAGNKLFDLEEAKYNVEFMGRFKNDPNGYVACTIRDNGSIYHPGEPIMTTYDRAGNRTEYQINYDKVGAFVDGYANVYEVAGTREENISFTGDFSSPDTYYSYKAVGSINSKGEFFNKTNKKESSSSSNEDYHLNNGYSLLKDKEGEWGNVTYRLVDTNGTEYGRYIEVQGVMNGNQFIARPYKTKEEVAQYIGQHGENPNGLTDYCYPGAEYMRCDLTPRTVFEVN